MADDFDVVCDQPPFRPFKPSDYLTDPEVADEYLRAAAGHGSGRLREALMEVVDTLPLTERQRELAMETVRDVTREEAEAIIDGHRKLVDGLPAALEAVRRIRRIRPR